MVPEAASSRLCYVPQLPAPWTDTKKGQSTAGVGINPLGTIGARGIPISRRIGTQQRCSCKASPLDAVAMPLSSPVTSDTPLSLLVAMSELPGRASYKPGCHHGTAREPLGRTCVMIWLGKGMGRGHPHPTLPPCHGDGVFQPSF